MVWRKISGSARMFVAVSAMLVFAGCAKRETLFIISTNDIHGAIERMPALATLVDAYRSQDTAAVLLVDAGDRWTGNPYVDKAAESGRPVIELMNTLGYDVATFGNHEFDNGTELLDKRDQEADFDLVLANIRTGDTPLSQPPAYVVKQAGNRKVCFVGLITNFIDGHPDGDAADFAGLEFPSPFSTAASLEFLRDSCDLFVALSHLGDDADTILADSLPSLDLIVGGHTHTVIPNGRRHGNTLITQTGNKLRNVGVTKVVFKGRRVEAIDNHLVALDGMAPDSAFLVAVRAYYDAPELNRQFGTLATTMTRVGAANLFTDVLRASMKTELALYHIGGVRTDTLEPGPIRFASLYEMEPFESRAYRVNMTLPQIRDLIIRKYNDTQNPKEAHAPDIFPSGMNYTIITDENDTAVDVRFDLQDPNPRRRYSVAISDYMYKIYKFDKPEVVGQSELLTDLLMKRLGTPDPYRPDNTMRIRVEER